MSEVRCPKCTSTNIRRSLQRSTLERLAGMFLGMIHLRCRECDERFAAGLVEVRNSLYARCPRCYRLDLTTWNRKHIIVTASRKLLLFLGAKPRRCARCRCNFVSFRPVKRAPGRKQVPVYAPSVTPVVEPQS